MSAPRFALFYPDGSVAVLRDGATLEDALRECWDADMGCDKPPFTLLGTVRVTIEGYLDVIETARTLEIVPIGVETDAAHG